MSNMYSSAPPEYTPAYCNAQIIALSKAIENAISASESTSVGQEKLVRQSIENINKALSNGSVNFQNMAEDIKHLEQELLRTQHEMVKELNKFKNLVYTGAIGGLIIFGSSVWALLDYITKLQV